MYVVIAANDYNRQDRLYLSSIMIAAFSQIELTLFFIQALLEFRASTVCPALSANSASMKAAVALVCPFLSSTFLIACAIFLKVCISERE